MDKFRYWNHTTFTKFVYENYNSSMSFVRSGVAARDQSALGYRLRASKHSDHFMFLLGGKASPKGLNFPGREPLSPSPLDENFPE